MATFRSSTSQLIATLERTGHFVGLIEVASRSLEGCDMQNAFAVGLDEVTNLLKEALQLARQTEPQPKRGRLDLMINRERPDQSIAENS